jgi:multiple sugar transport system ATP-binding protein
MYSTRPLSRYDPPSAMATVTYDHVTKKFDDTAAVQDLTLQVADGEFMVLVGPSGCGKSTALRMLAGLEKVSDGRILIGEHVVNNVAPQSRDIAMVFQSYALYPHMTVYDNLAFGLRNHKVPKKDIDRRVRKAADILDLDPLIKRKPKQLSGGQRQRVALGRAIVREPEAFLMDEPLSNLDAQLRVQTRAEILKLQESLGTTTIYVTHDQGEAMTMGDRIAVMKLGVLQQVGSPEDLYRDPQNVFVAGFIGSPAMNLVPAAVIDGIGGSDRIAGFRPEHVDLGNSRGDGVSFEARVEVVEYLGDEQLVHMTRKDTPLQAKLPVEEKLSGGQELTFSIPRHKLLLFDAQTEQRVRN